MRIAVGADHLGLPLKESVKAHLEEAGHEVVDYGVHETTPVDYPDVAVEVARAVADGEFERAILVCGTGIGMAITANKVPGVRAANVAEPTRRSARRSRTTPRCSASGRASWLLKWRRSSSTTGFRRSSRAATRPGRWPRSTRSTPRTPAPGIAEAGRSPALRGYSLRRGRRDRHPRSRSSGSTATAIPRTPTTGSCPPRWTTSPPMPS